MSPDRPCNGIRSDLKGEETHIVALELMTISKVDRYRHGGGYLVSDRTGRFCTPEMSVLILIVRLTSFFSLLFKW